MLRKIDAGFDATNRGTALARIRERLGDDEYLTGLLHVSDSQAEFHELNRTPDEALNQIPYAQLNPGPAALAKVLARYR